MFIIFGGIQVPLSHSVVSGEGSLYAKNKLDPFSSFDTIPAYDGWTWSDLDVN